MNNTTKGAISIVLAATFLALMAMNVKFLGGEIPLTQQVFFRNFVMLFISGGIILKNGYRFFGVKENRRYLIQRSIFGLMGVVSSFYANVHLNLGDAQALLKLSPFVVTFFAITLLGERVSKARVFTLFSAFAGALFIINPQFNSELLPSLIGLSSAFFAGSAYVTLSALSRKPVKEKGMTVIFVFSLFSTICTLPFMIQAFVPPTPTQWFLLLMIGIFAALGQYFITLGYGIAHAADISIFDYSGVIVAALIGKLVFKETLEWMSIVGIAIIITSGLIAYMDNRRFERNRVL